MSEEKKIKVRVITAGSGLTAVIKGRTVPAPKGYEFEVSRIHPSIASVVEKVVEDEDLEAVLNDRDEMDELREEYHNLFGEKANKSWNRDYIQKKIDEKKAE